MQSEAICLVIIFNHRYDDNIAKLRTIYKNRFKRVLFLMPFYDGSDRDVIPVYESSLQFPGFLIQAYERLMQIEADYYFFVGDDVILTPSLTENNILDKLKMKNKSVFTKSCFPLNSRNSFEWSHSKVSSKPFFQGGTQWKGSIPSRRAALEKFYDFFGKEYGELYDEEFFGNTYMDNLQRRYKEIGNFIQQNGNSLKIPYPMARGYSDIFMVKREKLFPIARLCGVFSAMDMFAEISFPTAIALLMDRCEVVLLDDIDFSCKIDWGTDREDTEEKYNCDLERLYKDWEAGWLFIHPVKLSKWKLSEEIDW